MAGYLVPALLLIATALGAQMAFGSPWAALALTIVVALALPYGDLRGKPLFLVLAGLPGARKRKRRRGYRRHRYYSP
jgi:hypothetical protein